MTESNSLDNLFSLKTTREQFLKNYNILKNSQISDEDLASVFTSDVKDGTVGELFKTLDKDGNDELSQDEIDALRKYYDDNDNNKKVTLNDLNELYSNTIKRLEKQNVSEKSQSVYDNTASDKPDSSMESLENQIEIIIDLKEGRKKLYESKIQRIQNELNSLVITSKNLTQAEKREYADNINKINKKKAKKAQKEAMFEEKRNRMDLAKAEIEYIKNHRDPETPENKDKIKKYTKEYNDLKSECDSVLNDIDLINFKISKLYEKQQVYINKVQADKVDLEHQKQALMTSLKLEESSYISDSKSYESQLSALKASQEIARASQTQNYSSEIYQDEDTSHFSYDAAALKKKWSKSHPDLSDGFYNKVCEVAKRVGCDSDALMALMQSESGIKADKPNSQGSGAMGLIQFMPKTAKSLGTSTAALSCMSAEEQLNYVQKYLLREKKSAGFKRDEKLDSGSLYALVLAPAYAKRDVLYTSGTKAYSMNKGLDKDGDKQITKADLRVRINGYIPKG